MVKVPAAAEAVVEELDLSGDDVDAPEDLSLEDLADPTEPPPTVKPVKAVAKKAPATVRAEAAVKAATSGVDDLSADEKKARIAAIRAWGNLKYGAGTVGDRGRINADLVAAYDAQDSSLFTPGQKKAVVASAGTGKKRGRPAGSVNKAVAPVASNGTPIPSVAAPKVSAKVALAGRRLIELDGQLVVVEVVGHVTLV